jgi:hypothetical protein
MSPRPTRFPSRQAQQSTVLHQQLLAALTATKPTSWTHYTIDPESPDQRKPNLIKTKVTGTELRFPLAQNVSEENVERAAARWAKAVA